MKEKAQLILEDGTRFQGEAFGYLGETVGEVVFNTGMTGYQELLTDPSYAGQIVTMTYPLIGNYGINLEDFESVAPKLKGFVVREACDCPSNWRCEMDLGDYLKGHKIMGIQGVDTRALTLMLRKSGTMRGIITQDMELSGDKLKKLFDSLDNSNVIAECTTKEKYELVGKGKRIAFLDLGAKKGILRELHKRGCHINVFPAFATKEEILASKPDCLFLSNGPGDPKDVPEVIAMVASMVGEIPMLGVCMGNQLINLALGGDTRKMRFGHHGGNHPVRDVKTGKVYITSQNHEYVVDALPDCLEAAYVNVNDGSIEGVSHKTLPIHSVQFHPEASPGPLDTNILFDKLLALVERGETNA
ncbi:MAG: glutamine-hydrolyzing carbamoyl-phosphate synthase small subunit [Eubacteriales bacterium]